MNVSEALGRIDALLEQSVTISGHLTMLSSGLEGPWCIRPTKEAELCKDAIQIDLTNLNRELDEIVAGTRPAKNMDLASFLMLVPTRVEGPKPHQPREVGMVEITGRLAPPVDPEFAASLTDLVSIIAIRPDHVYRFRRGIELSEFLAADAITVTDALERHIELDQQQVHVTGTLIGVVQLTYLAPDRFSVSDQASCILNDPAMHEALMRALPMKIGGQFTHYHRAQVTGRLVSGGLEPFPATLKEIVNITVQDGQYCVFSWGPMVGEQTANCMSSEDMGQKEGFAKRYFVPKFIKNRQAKANCVHDVVGK